MSDWFVHNDTLRAYGFIDLMEGIAAIYREGKAIANPEEAYKCGNMYVVKVTVDPEEAERNRFLTWKALAQHLQPLKSKNKLIMWAKRVYELELDEDEKMLALKQKILDNAFPLEAEGYFYKEEPEQPKEEEQED